MDIHFDPRAEVALRSLTYSERNRVEQALDGLKDADAGKWQHATGAQALRVIDGQTLYSVQAGDDLRLLTKTIAGALIVQDIISREWLESISARKLA